MRHSNLSVKATYETRTKVLHHCALQRTCYQFTTRRARYSPDHYFFHLMSPAVEIMLYLMHCYQITYAKIEGGRIDE